MRRILWVLLLLSPAIASAQSCPTTGGSSADSLWTASLGAGAASAPTTDSQFNPAPSPASTMYLFKGNSLYFLNNPTPAGNTGMAVTAAGVSTGFNQSINNNQAVPVPLKNSINTLSVFVGGNDGYVYRYDVNRDKVTGAITFPQGGGGSPVSVGYTWRTYVGRLDVHGAVLCPGNDAVTAAPVVQLYNYSDANFQSTFGDDMVYVITRYSGAVGTSCAATTSNRIYALKASTGAIYSSPKWPINANGSILMDYGSETCTLHYGSDDNDTLNNTLYCGTNLSGAAPAYQHSVHAFNSITGVKQWGANVGAVVTRPQFRPETNRVYALNAAGALYALDGANAGAALWQGGSIQTTVGGGLGTKNPWAEPRITGGLTNLLMVVGVGGTDNQLHAIVDNGSTAVVSWNTNLGSNVTTVPSISNVMGKVYVGLADSTVHQLDINKIVGGHPNDDAHAVLGGAGGNVYDIGLDVVGANATDINALNVANGSNLRRFCVPWVVSDVGTSRTLGGSSDPDQPLGGTPPCSVDSDCSSFASTCSTGKCTNSVCHSVPANEGNACNDGITCTTPDICRSGRCSGTPTANCPTLGASCDPATNPCNPAYICCGAVCVDAQSDEANCGGCGNACQTGWTKGLPAGRLAQTCQAGTCQRNSPAFCPTIADAPILNGGNNSRFNGAEDITYTNYRHDSSNPFYPPTGVCSAFVVDGNWQNTHGFIVGVQPSAASTTISYTGTGCNVCGVAYTRVGSGSSITKTFTDPSGGGGQVTKLEVQLNGENDACVTSTVSVYLANPSHAKQLIGTASTNVGCACNACYNGMIDVSLSVGAGIPTYANGGTNTLEIDVTGGAIDMTSATVFATSVAPIDLVWDSTQWGYTNTGGCDYTKFWYNSLDVVGANNMYTAVTTPTTEVAPGGACPVCPVGLGHPVVGGAGYCDHTITAALPVTNSVVAQPTFDSRGSSQTGDAYSCNTSADCSGFASAGDVCATNTTQRMGNSAKVCTGASKWEEFNQGPGGPTIDYRQGVCPDFSCGTNIRNGQVDFWFWEANWAVPGDMLLWHNDCSTTPCQITSAPGYLNGWPANGDTKSSNSPRGADFCPSAGLMACTLDSTCTAAYGSYFYCDSHRTVGATNKCVPDILIFGGAQRITAVSFGPTDNGAAQPVEWLLAAEGTRLFAYDANADKYNRCHIVFWTDLATSYVPDTANGQAAPIKITHISTDPYYNDFYVDFRDANYNYETAVVKNQDLSVHNLAAISRDLKVPNPVPYYWTDEGVTTPRSGAALIRMNGIGPTATPTFSSYGLLP